MSDLQSKTPLIVLLEDVGECEEVVAQVHFAEHDESIVCYVPEVRGLGFFTAGLEVDEWWHTQGLDVATDLRYLIKHDKRIIAHLRNLAGRVDVWVEDDPSLTSLYRNLENVNAVYATTLQAFLVAANVAKSAVPAPIPKGAAISSVKREHRDLDEDADVNRALEELASSGSGRRSGRTTRRPSLEDALDESDLSSDPMERTPVAPTRPQRPTRSSGVGVVRPRPRPSRGSGDSAVPDEARYSLDDDVDPDNPFNPQPKAAPEPVMAPRPPGPDDHWAFDYLARMESPVHDLPLAGLPDEMDADVTPRRETRMVVKAPPKPKKSWRPPALLGIFGRSSSISTSNLETIKDLIMAAKPLIIAVGSVKGGSGKTTTAKEIAIISGKALAMVGLEAAFVDANLANPDAWDDFKIPVTAPTVQDISYALTHNTLPPREDMLRSELTPGLVVVPDGRDEVQYGEEEIQVLGTQYFLPRFPVTVVDLTNRRPSLSTSPEAKVAEAWLHLANVVIVPMRLEPADMRSTTEYLDTPQLPPAVVCYIEPRDTSILGRDDVSKFLSDVSRRAAAVLSVPDSPKVATAHFEGQPVGDLAPQLGAAYSVLLEQCLRLAKKTTVPRPGSAPVLPQEVF